MTQPLLAEVARLVLVRRRYRSLGRSGSWSELYRLDWLSPGKFAVREW